MTLQFPVLICCIPIIVAMIPIIIGVIMVAKHLRAGFFVIGLGVLIGIVIGPSLFLDRLTITDSEIEHRTGFWFSQRVYGLEYANISQIVIRTESDRRGRQQEIWYFTDISGKEERVDPGDLWVMSRTHVLSACRDRDIDVRAL